MDRAELLAALRSRAEMLVIPELGRNQLHLTQRIASGAFGTVYKAEGENVPDYGGVVSTPLGGQQRKVVAAKYLPNASDKDR